MGTSTPEQPATKRPAFTIACGLFASIAFVQLLSVGVAIAARTGETREVVRYIQDAPLIVSVPTLRDEAPLPSNLNPRSVAEMLKEYTDDGDSRLTPPASSTFNTPQFNQPAIPETASLIQDPMVEKLVRDGHLAHNQGDLIKALLKLEEAESRAPHEPAIFYRKALLFEDMGQWERATDNYEKLFVMGPSIGVYYHKSAFKLSNGINPQTQKEQTLIIGQIMRRISDDRLQARLTIPIRSVANTDFDPSQLEIKVHHYDLVDKKKIEAVPPSRAENIQDRWLHEPLDWADDEEIAESSYRLPPIAEAEVHLFGERSYFGYVAELYYKNELIDQQAYPRRLHAIHADQQRSQEFAFPLDFPLDEALPNINPDNPLLPALPRH
jgi:tetratricopeptide (TPR) repeat protein